MRAKREHIKKFSRLPLWWQLVSGLFLCFFCSVVVTAACLFLDMKEISKNNWSYLREINEQWKTEIETITANVDRFRYLHLVDNRIEAYLKKKKKNNLFQRGLRKKLIWAVSFRTSGG